jgi:hypothetical protein
LKTKPFCKSSNYVFNVQLCCVTRILLGAWGDNFHRLAFTLSEWWSGLCSIAGDPLCNKICKGVAYVLHRVKGCKISAKTACDICTYSILVPNCSILFILTVLLSGIYKRTKIKNMAHLRVEYCLILTVADFVFYCTKNGIFIFRRMVRNKVTQF